MTYKIIAILLLTIHLTPAFSNTNISVSNKLQKSDIEFYSQSSNGKLITCGIEFSGIDNNLNYFSGSYSILYLGNGNISPMLKMNSIKIHENGNKETHSLQNFWIKSKNQSTLATSWESNRKDNTIIFTDHNHDEGIILYIEITRGEETKIGYLKNGATIDSIYELKRYPKNSQEKAKECLMEMTKIANQDINANK